MTISLDPRTGATGILQDGVEKLTLTSGGLSVVAPLVSANSPAFSAYSSTSPTLANITWAKCPLDTAPINVTSAFNTTLNRFQPSIAGYYQVNGSIIYSFAGNGRASRIAIYGSSGTAVLNGTTIDTGTGSVSVSGLISVVSGIIYLNGSTDFIELWNWSQINTSTCSIVGGSTGTTFSAALLIRTA